VCIVSYSPQFDAVFTEFVVYSFWATVCKTVRPMVSERTVVLSVCLYVCDVSALWPNG